MNAVPPEKPDEEELDPRLCRMALAEEATGRLVETVQNPETDRLLDAFRQGSLSPGDRQDLLTRLRREPALRRCLAARAGVAPVPPAAIRDRVLAKIAPKKKFLHRGRWLAAAAALVVALGLALLSPPSDLPPEVSYSVEIRGIAAVREPSGNPGPAEAFSNTVIRMIVRPAQEHDQEVVFAVYRAQEGSLARVPETDIEVARHGGAATLSAEAGNLIAGGPGTHTLYLVVARSDDLPPEIAMRSGDDLRDRLTDGGRRRAYPVSIRLLPNSSEESPSSGGTAP